MSITHAISLAQGLLELFVVVCSVFIAGLGVRQIMKASGCALRQFFQFCARCFDSKEAKVGSIVNARHAGEIAAKPVNAIEYRPRTSKQVSSYPIAVTLDPKAPGFQQRKARLKALGYSWAPDHGCWLLRRSQVRATSSRRRA